MEGRREHIMKYLYIFIIYIIGFCGFSLSSEGRVFAYEISEDTVVAMNEAEFYAALNSQSVTTIHLGADLILASNTTLDYTINKDKAFLIIDGQNPYAETEEERAIYHTVTEYDSSIEDRTIRLRNTGELKEITVRNIDIVGKNHYGFVSIAAPAVSIYYENITYSGPQLTHNIYGKAFYKDCNITITKNGVSPVGEVGEASAVELAGNIIIEKPDVGADEIFLIKNTTSTSPELVVRENAYVEITHNNTPYGGFVYSDPAGYPITIKENAVFIFHGYQFVFESAIPGLLELEKNAEVYIDLKTTGVNGGLYVNNLIVGENAIFHLTAGASTADVALLAIRDGGTAAFNNPRSVFLKMESTNTGAYVMRGQASYIDMNVQQLNYWLSPFGGGLDAPPDYHWDKNGELLNVQCRLTLPGIWNEISTNFSLENDKRENTWLNTAELNESNFASNKARIISMGSLDLTADYLNSPFSSIAGVTREASQVQTKLIGEDGREGPVTADGNGEYRIPVDNAEKGQIYLTLAHNQYLYREIETEIPPPKYSIKYLGNGNTSGEPPIDDFEYEEGEYAEVLEPGELLKAGYKFIGWNRLENGSGDWYIPGGQLEMNEDIMLFAQWELATVDFKFKKVSAEDFETVIEGTEFTLYVCGHIHDLYCNGLEDSSLCTHVHDELAENDGDNCWKYFSYGLSDEYGNVMFTQMPSGLYQMVETKTAPGYELPYGQWRILTDAEADKPFQILGQGSEQPPAFMEGADNHTFILPNNKTLVLPFVGGVGRVIYLYVGFTLIGMSILFLIYKNRILDR